MMAKVVIPKKTLQEISDIAFESVTKEYLKDHFEKQFNEIKKQMISEFLEHPVTEEIMNGHTAENTSGTLSGRTTNLFSFIGFDHTDNPILDVVNILEMTTIQFLYPNRKLFTIKIILPSPKYIFSKTPMPWAKGRSWAKGIESGISGLGYHIQKFNQGRSLGGIQIKKKISSGKFNNTPYISALISKYEKEFSSINYSNIRISKL